MCDHTSLGKVQVQTPTYGDQEPPDIFQDEMRKMFNGFELIMEYLDDLLIIIKGGLYDHLQKLEPMLQKIKYNRLRCNIEKYVFGQKDMEYVGLWATRSGIPPINKK